MFRHLVFATILLCPAVYAFAGAISGGGGKGVVCRNADDSIRSATTLDLYEGTALYGLSHDESVDPWQLQVERGLEKFPASSGGLVRGYAESVMKNMRLVHNIDLQDIDDALVVGVPHGCKAEQLANYFSDQNVIINGDIWDRMTPTAQASLILHEAVYANERGFGATNSLRTRHIVAALFDPQTAWTDPLEGTPDQGVACRSDSLLFRVVKNADGSSTLHFLNLGGGQVYSKKTMQIFEIDFDKLASQSGGVEPGENKIGSGATTYDGITSDFEGGDLLTIDKVWEPLTDPNGQIVKGFQWPRYYISWNSRTYPGLSFAKQPLSCGMYAESRIPIPAPTQPAP